MTEDFIITISVMLASVIAAHALMTRRRARDRSSFRCMVRVRRGTVEGLGARWCAGRAHWVHDVLIIDRRLTAPSIPIGVMGVASPRGPVSGHRLRELGNAPVGVRLLADGGAVVELVSKDSDAPMLTGPLVLGSGLAVLG
jgi:hypothetical protein